MPTNDENNTFFKERDAYDGTATIQNKQNVLSMKIEFSDVMTHRLDFKERNVHMIGIRWTEYF